MPACLKCHNGFPNRVWIEKKQRNLGKRKYCLECSPFGRGNRIKIHVVSSDRKLQRKCLTCGRGYIYVRGARQGHRLNKCNSCSQSDRAHLMKKRAVEMLGGKCTVCGYARCMSSLSFHHRNPDEKEFHPSHGYNRSWEIFSREIRKCVLVCANCHGEIHAGLVKL